MQIHRPNSKSKSLRYRSLIFFLPLSRLFALFRFNLPFRLVRYAATNREKKKKKKGVARTQTQSTSSVM